MWGLAGIIIAVVVPNLIRAHVKILPDDSGDKSKKEMLSECDQVELIGFILGGILIAISILFFAMYRRRVSVEGPIKYEPAYARSDDGGILGDEHI
jgi:hypothetical protein